MKKREKSNGEVDREFEYKIYYNKKTNQIQGKEPCYMVVADVYKQLPAMVQPSPDIEVRRAKMIVYKK